MDAENGSRMALQTVQGSKTPVPEILRNEYQIYVVSAAEPDETAISGSTAKSATRQNNLQSSKGENMQMIKYDLWY